MTGLLTSTAVLCAVAISSPPAEQPRVTVAGLVQLIEHIDVPSRSDGLLKHVHVKEGKFVKKGDLLGQLDDESAKLSLQRAQAEQELAEAKAQSETAIQIARLTRDAAAAEFGRAKQTRQSSPTSISSSEFDRLRLEADKSELEFSRVTEERRFSTLAALAKSLEVQMSKHAVEERRFHSSLDGMVVQLHRREGEWVKSGERIIRIVRIDKLRVEAFVNLNLHMSLSENLPVVFVVEGAGSKPKEFPGELVFVNPEADVVNGQLMVWAEIENTNLALRPGQRGQLKILLKESQVVTPTDQEEPIQK